MRAAFGDDHYHVGVRLVGFETTNDKVTARFEGGREEACDLLVGADGPGSTVRGQLLPSVRSEYAGYVAWRGVVLEHQAPDLAAEFAERFTFFQAPHTHILCYLIPGPDGSLQPGQRRLNWVWYLNAAPGDELDRVLTDKDGRRRQFSVPQGFVAPDMTRLAARPGPPHPAARRSCGWWRRPTEPFVQTIHDLAVPKMAFGRVCLTGDAAFVPRPHTAASTAKAAANALALGRLPDGHQGRCGRGAAAVGAGPTGRWASDYGIHGQRLGNRSQFDR